MKAKKLTKNPTARPASGSTRKSAAPPGHPLTQAKPEERAHPAERKAKHKHPPQRSDDTD